VKLRHLLRSFACHQCGRVFRCECGYVTVGLIIAGVIAAASAGYGAYAANQAQQQQYAAAKEAAKSQQMAADQQAQAEYAAGQARAAQIQYNSDKMRRSFLSREAGAGVQVGQGSLLETEGQFGFDTEYSKQLAKYPHELAGASDAYASDLFGQKGQLYGNLKSATAAGAFGSVAGATAASAAGSATKVYSSLASQRTSSGSDPYTQY
jgi:hypothetical protein